MTPAEDYAQKRAEAVELIRTHAPTRLQEPLIELLRPAIALSATRADDSQIPLGASKFGGAPDVPLGFEWPTWNEEPLGFLAQINLEEVAPFDVDELLPKSGLLSFFYDWESQPWGGNSSESEAARVFHFTPEAEKQGLLFQSLEFEEIKFHRQNAERQLAACQLQFSLQLHLPDFAEPRVAALIDELDGETGEWNPYQMPPFDALWDLRKAFAPQKVRHHLLGSPDYIQGPLNFDKEALAFLFQLDSDPATKTSWGDCGRLYFHISPQNLATRNFTAVSFHLQCS